MVRKIVYFFLNFSDYFLNSKDMGVIQYNENNYFFRYDSFC